MCRSQRQQDGDDKRRSDEGALTTYLLLPLVFALFEI